MDGAGSSKDRMMYEVCHAHEPSTCKVTVVGVGEAGMAAAYCLTLQGLATELCLVDIDANCLKGEMMDLQHGQAFLRRVHIMASTDYSITANSKVCVIAAGAKQKVGESRLDLAQRNVPRLKEIVPNLVKYSPDTILVIMSDPVDILAYAAWKISGLPMGKVIGTGTMLDSARFRFLVGERLGISPKNCHGWIIGEHGDSSVAVWSGLNVAGINLCEVSPTIGTDKDPENWNQVHKDVVNSAYDIIKLKGYTSWSRGVMAANLCTVIIRSEKSVLALSTLAKGFHGIEEEVFLSLPCVVDGNGITHVFNQTLNESEESKLRASAKVLLHARHVVKW